MSNGDTMLALLQCRGTLCLQTINPVGRNTRVFTIVRPAIILSKSEDAALYMKLITKKTKPDGQTLYIARAANVPMNQT